LSCRSTVYRQGGGEGHREQGRDERPLIGAAALACVTTTGHSWGGDGVRFRLVAETADSAEAVRVAESLRRRTATGEP